MKGEEKKKDAPASDEAKADGKQIDGVQSDEAKADGAHAPETSGL